MKPDSTKHNPKPEHLRNLIRKAGLTQSAAAARIGVCERSMRYYLAERTKAPYPVQFALEALAQR